MKRTTVKSTSIRSIGYSPKQRILEVEFLSGKVYRYSDVPAQVYNQFLDAESKGAFLNEVIRDCYPFELVASRKR